MLLALKLIGDVMGSFKEDMSSFRLSQEVCDSEQIEKEN